MPRAGLDSAAVVTAAAELADADGLDAVTLARLADHLGVRSPSLYVHVAGLDDLRRRLGARGAAELAGALAQAASGKSRREALQAIALTYRGYARAHPGTYAAMQRAPADGDEQFARAGREVVGVIVAVLEGYGLHGDEAIHAVRVIRAALHGFVVLEREGGFALPIGLDDSYQRLIAVLDTGLAGHAFGAQ